MPNRQRNVQVLFMVTPGEAALLKQRMAMTGIRNKGAYLRTMALKGRIINLNMTELQETSRLLHNVANNLNQIAKRVNQTGSVYKDDIEDLQERYQGLETMLGDVLRNLIQL